MRLLGRASAPRSDALRLPVQVQRSDALNHEIHMAIVAAAKNATLIATHDALMTKARRSRYTALASEARWKEAMREHEALMQALEARDGPRAGEILFRHDLRTAETTRALLSESGA